MPLSNLEFLKFVSWIVEQTCTFFAPFLLLIYLSIFSLLAEAPFFQGEREREKKKMPIQQKKRKDKETLSEGKSHSTVRSSVKMERLNVYLFERLEMFLVPCKPSLRIRNDSLKLLVSGQSNVSLHSRFM